MQECDLSDDGSHPNLTSGDIDTTQRGATSHKNMQSGSLEHDCLPGEEASNREEAIQTEETLTQTEPSRGENLTRTH